MPFCRPATNPGLEPAPFAPALGKRAGIEPALSAPNLGYSSRMDCRFPSHHSQMCSSM